MVNYEITKNKILIYSDLDNNADPADMATDNAVMIKVIEKLFPDLQEIIFRSQAAGGADLSDSESKGL